MMVSQNEYQVTESDLDHLKQWFSRYVQSFYSADPVVQEGLVLKEKHSFRVCDEILNIGRKMDLSKNNLRLAEVMALFHDIGRFEQFARHKTFVDKKSENHGQLGVKVLEQENALAALPADARELILKSISYHNRLSVPEDESHICLYFSRLLRDADKLDIFHLVSTYYYADGAERSAAIELDLPDTPEVSEEIMACLSEGKLISMQHLRSLNDFKLLQMAWVYDVNYSPTFQMIYERDYLRKIRDTLPATEGIDRIYARLMSYLKENIDASASVKEKQHES
ncbi:MAG TPA: HD family phosphohydrolase [Syntrophaceae bacterium]|jgi:putative nucleotidyltransferase with HDIG domain|nr:HD family phosphohydrolase [Syntrophaceae bacterium]HBL54008.1 HD family phosphohydrolase [Syntrophaceae bacterium]HCS77074.1 HD family phosphohydrolase [Syntrophaceae bacterium]HCX02331.1 HD family phosphohydrolase [Syntrophaceae bacterium]